MERRGSGGQQYWMTLLDQLSRRCGTFRSKLFTREDACSLVIKITLFDDKVSGTAYSGVQTNRQKNQSIVSKRLQNRIYARLY